MTQPYRTLFVGTLVQESFLSVGGRDDPTSSLDSPFCLDGRERPTLRGSGLAGALVATLRRMRCAEPKPVPKTISGSSDGRHPSVWRCFNSHPSAPSQPVVRQHVAIDARTGAAATGLLFDVETLPPGTRWPFLLEVDTSRDHEAADWARQVLGHWAAGRCLLGREVARGLGWLSLEDCREYRLSTEQAEQWPCARAANDYPRYIREHFADFASPLEPTSDPLPGWCEIVGTLTAGEYQPVWHGDGQTTWGLDSLSIGGHASDELATAWSDRFLAPRGLGDPGKSFDPDFTVVTVARQGDGDASERLPYIPGSSLRGPLRHALARLLRAQGQIDADAWPPLVRALFGTTQQSAKLLVRDAFPDPNEDLRLAWFQHHAEDEFAGSTYGSGKFDRVAVMSGCFRWKMVLEDASPEEREALRVLFALSRNGQIGIGGGQWRGHGWLHWRIERFDGEEVR
ncbi:MULTISPECIES: RAMP superfamily CRISPR-associated protein [unclassified Thiocapsa]|uniref:RAMP superfamily CRISPR-associated protein n=1 Tax=unclassified Thiocapsa TaxID=2641286 RepID=UPI0035B39EBE